MEKCLKYISLLLIKISLLYPRKKDKIQKESSGETVKCWGPVAKNIFMKYRKTVSNLESYEGSERNLKFSPSFMQIKRNGTYENLWKPSILWKFSSYNFLTQEHCKLIVFKLISTFFRRLVSKVLDRILCFNLGSEFYQNKFFVYF